MQIDEIDMQLCDPDYSWTTYDEIEFIENLGRWGNNKKSRKECLHNYIKSSTKRSFWGEIDNKEVIRRVLELLSQYR